MAAKHIGFAGTYTRQNSKGIYRFGLDTETGTLDMLQVADEIGNPTYLTISADNHYLYSVVQDGGRGGINAYELDRITGTLQHINSQLTEGAPPCHLDIGGNVLVTGNYHKGEIGLHHVQKQGALEAGTFLKHKGHGIHERQEKSHVHYTGFTPDGKHVVAVDLGTDELVTYKGKDNKLTRVATLQVKQGSGPRHIVFHPNGNTAYLLTELSSEVIVLMYDAETGTFTEKQYIRTVPDNFTDKNDASAIRISADGKFVYAGNRGHNSIAVFQVDEESFTLSMVEIVPSGGEWPRDFIIDPSEAYIIVSNQHTGNLVLFTRNNETGKLSRMGSEIKVPEVVCVTFLR